MSENRNRISGHSFVGTLFTDDCRFDRAAFVNVNMQGVQIDDVNLSGAHINNTSLRNAVIADVNLEGLIIDGVPVAEALQLYREAHPTEQPPSDLLDQPARLHLTREIFRSVDFASEVGRQRFLSKLGDLTLNQLVAMSDAELFNIFRYQLYIKTVKKLLEKFAPNTKKS